MIGSTIGELVKLSFSDFHGKSNYGHLQISGAPNSRDHRLETTPPDDTIYSVSPVLDGGPWLVSRYFRQQPTNWKPEKDQIFHLQISKKRFRNETDSFNLVVFTSST